MFGVEKLEQPQPLHPSSGSCLGGQGSPSAAHACPPYTPSVQLQTFPATSSKNRGDDVTKLLSADQIERRTPALTLLLQVCVHTLRMGRQPGRALW